jgi:hypothetical protein
MEAFLSGGCGTVLAAPRPMVAASVRSLHPAVAYRKKHHGEPSSARIPGFDQQGCLWRAVRDAVVIERAQSLNDAFHKDR